MPWCPGSGKTSVSCTDWTLTHMEGAGGMAGRTVASKDILALILGSCDYHRLHGKGNWVADRVKVVDCLLSHIIQMSPG